MGAFELINTVLYLGTKSQKACSSYVTGGNLSDASKVASLEMSRWDTLGATAIEQNLSHSDVCDIQIMA